MSKNFRMWFSLLLVLPFYSEAETHAEVQEALDWELPVNTCKKPKIIAQSSNVSNSDGQGDREVTDVDSNTIMRYERKLARFESCVDEYKEALLVEFDEMKNCAQYGLSSEQADIILGKMALMQKVYLTADGIVEEAVD
jgi:hypothetical protein